MCAQSMEGDVNRNIMGMGGNSISRRCVCSIEVTSSHPQLEGPVQSTRHQVAGWGRGERGGGKGERGKGRGKVPYWGLLGAELWSSMQ